MIESLKRLRQYLLTGVSHAIPFIACGGILIAMALAFAPRGPNNAPDPSGHPILEFMLTIGVASLVKLMPIVLAGYVAYSIAGKPALVSGMIGGLLAVDLKAHFFDDKQPAVSAGFLGALVAGLLAGFLVQALKQIPTHKYVKPIMPILIVPIVSASVVGAVMIYVVGPPIADLLAALTRQLQEMQTGSAIVLAGLLGAMIAFDMGGPVNKAAFFFASGLIAAGNNKMMGPVGTAICTPPLGLGLATLIRRAQWSDEEKEAGIAALAMGTIGITEGAIPFAAADPIRIIPCIMFGSMVASTIAMLSGCGDSAPHGGLIVLPVVDNKLMYIVAIVAGATATAIAANVARSLKRKNAPEVAEVAA